MGLCQDFKLIFGLIFFDFTNKISALNVVEGGISCPFGEYAIDSVRKLAEAEDYRCETIGYNKSNFCGCKNLASNAYAVNFWAI